jgi:CheY-like chemotaxis protein
MRVQNLKFFFQYRMNIDQTKMVLLIDDDPVNNIVNTRIIERYMAKQVIVYDEAGEAFRQLSQWPHAEFPEIIFLDINMPEMNGWDFLEAMQELPCHVLDKCRIVMLSSSIDTADIKKARTYTMVEDFISKPLTVDKLNRIAAELLR